MLNILAVNSSQILSYVLIGVMVVILIVSMVLMNRRSKKRQQEAQDLIDAVKPGNKVKTIGGICGIVVEVDPEEDTFVLETGTETSGKCYIKFVRQAIYESDAVVDKDAKADKKAEEETAAEEPEKELPVAEETEAAEEKGADKE
ncbi:MAG: preprotein translocase subunit YajC [Clostridiales bacterium]|nr:preprotein translocase subunit YajC [Clostridiales bacterium]